MGFKLGPPPYDCDNTPIYYRDLNADEPGVMGKKNMNGSILIQTGLDPIKEAEVRGHEDVHAQDIKNGLLKYDDSAVYFREDPDDEWQVYDRSTMLEGAKNLPWEKRAWKFNKLFKKKYKEYYNA